jgi:hypothetical protein
MGVLILNVPPKVEAWLDEQARHSDMKKDDLALKVLQEAANGGQTAIIKPGSRSGTSKISQAFEQWCQTQPIRTGHPVDDSRESIYD